MRRRISLYIAGSPADLDEQSFILFNYTMDDVKNPTIIKNSYTQQVKLKGTPNNNKIFGGLYRADRQTSYGGGFAGAEFMPYYKTPFVIYNELNEVLEEGYVKVDKIVCRGRNVEYHVTLYGGLGAFFYGLMYKEDGTKKTLSDLQYTDVDGMKVNSFAIYPEAESVADAWRYLSNPDGFVENIRLKSFWNIINFAPMYNGVPDNFDASKALVQGRNLFGNIPLTATIDGISYDEKRDANSRLMSFTNPHTEWEINDLRWYLQRPVVSIKAIILAICDKSNNGGYDVELDETFFNDNNPYYNDLWMTLQMIPSEDRQSEDCIESLLRASSASPADILLSYAKVFGLYFLYDSGMRKVSVMTRQTFYKQGQTIDLTDRIDVSEIEVNPLVADSLIYQFGDKHVGQFAEEYRQDYSREYGIQRVNTGFEFNSQTTIVTKDVMFNDAVEVMEFNRLFTSGGYTRNVEPDFLLPAFESVTVQLWGEDSDGEQVSTEIPMRATQTNFIYDNPSFEYGDWLPKVQLHNQNKVEKGDGVLVLYAGMKETPNYSYGKKQYWLTDDHPDMNLLNQGTPCWNLRGDGTSWTVLPSFRRNIEKDGIIEHSLEWGVPLVRGVPGIAGTQTIYNEWWKRFISDLYDDDTKVMTCKVNMRGLFVNQSLLRNFFWYNNTLWRLNKIINHSLTTWDDTECEFVKVQDKSNYLN